MLCRFTLFALCTSIAVGAARADELVIAFTLDTPPYVNDQGRSGISIDIVREALKRKGHTFRVEQMSYGQLADAVIKRGVDAAATVIKANDGTFYSENYITFKNVAIVKQASGIQIKGIADLKGHSIVAWQNAYEDLGPEFQALFSPKATEPYREKYHEIANQKQQVAMFWKGEAEVLVIDDSVMKWFTKELAKEIDTSAPLTYFHIFPPQTQFRISFKNKPICDDFDAGFDELRKSGLVEQIYDRYLK